MLNFAKMIWRLEEVSSDFRTSMAQNIYIYIKVQEKSTLPKFNSSPLNSYENPIGKKVVFQAPFFRGKLAVKLRGCKKQVVWVDLVCFPMGSPKIRVTDCYFGGYPDSNPKPPTQTTNLLWVQKGKISKKKLISRLEESRWSQELWYLKLHRTATFSKLNKSALWHLSSFGS